jgi:RNA 3'-terminal phosphate cyclase (ATP)
MSVSDAVILVDGSEGEGGGQILRSSLTLSMATGKPFRIFRIRAGRRKPGLLRQHLASVRAAARVCNAHVEGAELGSQSVVFRPGPVVPGEYAFAVAGAGSSTLVFQTVLPALLAAGRPFRLTLEGGTHNPAAPPLEFLERAYLAALARMGVETVLQVERRGFFPAGGGKWSIGVTPPSAPRPLYMRERGEPLGHAAKVLWNRIPAPEPERARAHLARGLGWDPASIASEEARESPGPGHVILAELRYRHATEVVTAFNAFGASPEAVCDGLIADLRRFMDAGVPVGWRLADQLLLPMALGAGGAFLTLPLSLHARTNIGTIGKFLDRPIAAAENGDGNVEVRVG